ncbi:MAG TPA: heavy-metal-associated domain-containing protein [Gemmatimonadales bacterium]|nr:heavy-metal-associated domain-containing protein [Gemmatimonadales bacterium]
MERVTLRIDGMSCGHCVAQVGKALRSVPGVDVEQVEIGSATLSYDPDRTSTQDIREAVENQGYSLKP